MSDVGLGVISLEVVVVDFLEVVAVVLDLGIVVAAGFVGRTDVVGFDGTVVIPDGRIPVVVVGTCDVMLEPAGEIVGGTSEAVKDKLENI